MQRKKREFGGLVIRGRSDDLGEGFRRRQALRVGTKEWKERKRANSCAKRFFKALRRSCELKRGAEKGGGREKWGLYR